MNCRKARSYLSTYCERALSSEVTCELEAHIRNCKSCEREKLYIDEIVVAAKSLPSKTVPDDFNLKLFSRIYAEQNSPTESYLPLRQPMLFSPLVKWGSALATVCATALVTFMFMHKAQPAEEKIPYVPSYASVESNTPPDPDASSLKGIRHGRTVNIYDNVIGVSGELSNYRATNVAYVKGLNITNPTAESLTIALHRRSSKHIVPSYALHAPETFSNSVAYYPAAFNPNGYSTSSGSSPVLRNASAHN